MEFGINLFFCILIVFAVFCDMKKHIIPNRLIAVGILAAGFDMVMEQGVCKLAAALGGMMIPFLLLFPLFAVRMMGAGDIKFLCMLAFMLQPGEIIYLLFYSCLIGGIWAAAKMVKEKSTVRRFRYLKNYLVESWKRKETEKYFIKEKGYADTISFALPIGLSYLLHLGGMY